MIAEYIQGALRKAHYELEEGTYFAEIGGFDGVLASGETLEACREELIDVLEGWLIVGIRHGHVLPVVDEIDLNLVMQPV